MNEFEVCGTCSIYMEEMRNAYKISVRKHEGIKPFRRCRCTWENNINMDLKK